MNKKAGVFPAVLLAGALLLNSCGGGEPPALTTLLSSPETTPTPGPALTPAPSPTAGSQPTPMMSPPPPEEMEMIIFSTVFEEGGPIPSRYSCDGANVSPGLEWSGVPDGTMSFVLILDDPDAPGGTFTHWVIYNIPAGSRGLAEGIARTLALPDGTAQGRNSFGQTGYGGPCPPPGAPHRYIFTLYALDTMLDFPAGAEKAQVLTAIEGHILEKAVLVGTYQR